ncbi:fungal specific transcription factor domain-containing protein [Colletotrichum asianum]
MAEEGGKVVALPILTEELDTVGRSDEIAVAALLVDTGVEEKELEGKISEMIVVDIEVVLLVLIGALEAGKLDAKVASRDVGVEEVLLLSDGMENEELELIDSAFEVVEDTSVPEVAVLEVEILVVEVVPKDDEKRLLEALDELIVKVGAVDELRDAEQNVAVRIEAARIPYTEYRVVYIATGQPALDEAEDDAVITPPHLGLPKGG